ncbi:bifunctional hexulose-6-phosphate synthase/ribonuclease regulator [Candidatus Micrarchaeota archaeon CG08_land_8_20_14_0_20_49_17]|nr:MAG: hypothetical protein AUJ13_00130 [Candidatus Micrarchaeota archaeon CG1_02_49_24]PIU09345.1 MAG: bifunctional hexulose-6-phosphate synthase/ribonuclease regulator [Candidatus Micrarchaeota archaeon CG08_land_8_20_14_0_20_49_17]HII53500.1 bifunctional hexulose-6-phosphate synthase/ribonuclease regulator [Candidatus Micrarchaeota archaeon]
MALLQIALDFIDRERALAVAAQVAPYVDIIEAGTPLIKSEGLGIVRTLRKRFPSKLIVADMKIMDTGGLEAEIAVKAGADIVTVMGASDISTIEQAIISAKKYGKQVMVDILNASAGQLKLIEALRPAPAYLCVHTSIDQQMKGQKPFAVLGKLRTKIPVAVAGGITTESAALVLRNKGVAIVIVGGGITKEANPAKAAAELKKIMKNKIKLKFAAKSFEKNNEEKINAAKQMKKSGVSTPNISDGMMRSGSLGDFPLFLNREKLKSLILGRAVTVSVPEGDWAKVVEAIDLCKPGQVLVINEIGDGRAVFGGLACRSCVNRKVAAVIVNGAARDVDEIERLGLPVLARKALPNAGEPSGFGKINVPVEINGIRVAPGDLIAIDKSGAVAIPASRAVEYANRALDVKEKEIRIAKEIGKKGTLGNVMNIKKWELSWKKD